MSRHFPNVHQREEKMSRRDVKDKLKSLSNDCLNIADRIVAEKIPEQADKDDCMGLYVGPAGMAYAFLRLSRRTFVSADESKEYLSVAQRYLGSCLESVRRRGNKVDCAFILGDAGIFAVTAVVAAASSNNDAALKFARRFVRTAERFKKMRPTKCSYDDLFFGRAGFLCGALWLNRELGKRVVPLELMHETANAIVRSGRSYARANLSPCPLMYESYGTKYLGAAYGLSGILQVLIQVPEFLDANADTEAAVRGSVDFVLSLQTPSGNFPRSLEQVKSSGQSSPTEPDETVEWCHDAPGVIHLMAAAFLRWKDEKYLISCRRVGELVWDKGLVRKGPGICHGVAGNGYVFLILHRLTKETRHLRRAIRFCEFLSTPQFQREARTPDEPYSLYEGLAGTMCFLGDVVEPHEAAFPFQDVF